MGKKLPNTPRSRIKNAIRQAWLKSRERAAALKATKHTCARCGIKASQAKGREVKLQVHHIGGINWDGVVDLIFERVLNVPQEPLCVECHAKEHATEASVGLISRSDGLTNVQVPTEQENAMAGNLNRFNDEAGKDAKA